MSVFPDRVRLVRIAVLFGLAVLLGWIAVTIVTAFWLPKSKVRGQETTGGEMSRQAEASVPSLESPKPSNVVSTPTVDAALIARFDAAVHAFSQGLSPDAARKKLKELADAAAELDPTVAAGSIIAFLDSGRDASTGLGFRVVDGGKLSDAPSLRVSALDLLGRTGSPEAASYSVGVMDEAGVADEYAVALRNFAWGTENLTEVGNRFSDMLDRDEWLGDPSAGFMEAFDVAVAAGGVNMVLDVSNVVLGPGDIPAGETAALNRPAFIALDRLVIRDPSAVVAAFQIDPELLSWAPNQRASVLSRADVTDPAQRQMLENYLLATQHGDGELAYFKEIFPNVNGIDGYRLVTEGAEIRNVRQVDSATLAVIAEWQADPRFSGLRPTLDSIQRRLQGFGAE
jgi:hypothetical protein